MKKITLFMLMIGFSSFMSAQCLDEGFGQFPADSYTPDTCDGLTINVITDDGYAGEYTVVVLNAGETYTFTSSVSTDYITVSSDGGLTSVVSGTTPVTWVSDVSGEVRVYTNIDDLCGEEDLGRIKGIICGTVSADAPDYVSLQWPPTATFTQGGSVNVYGQVYEAGLTDVAPNVDGQAPGIQMWVGISPEGDNSNPNTWTNWEVATFNAAHVSNNDEYMASIGSDLSPGTYYYATRFRLNTGGYVYGGTNGSNGNFWDGATFISGVLTVDAPPAPANDACSGATVVSAFPYTFAQTDAIGSTNNDGFITVCSDDGMNDGVWYTFVGDGNNIQIDVTPDDTFDPQLGIYTGTCGSLTCVGTVDDGFSAGDPETYTIHNSVVGTTYYVNIGNYSSSTDNQEGNFTIEMTSTVPPPAPANDECVNAVVLNCGDTLTNQTTDGATGGTATSCIGTIGDDIWYKITGNGQNIKLTAVAAGEPAQIEVYESTDGTCSGFTAGDCFASAGTGDNTTEVAFNSTTGTQYYIHIGSWINGDPATVFDLSVTCVDLPASVPDCASNPSPADGAVNVPTGDVVFTWTAPTTAGVPVDSYDFYGGTTTPLTNADFIGNFTTTSADITITGYDLLLYWKIVPKNLAGDAVGCTEWSFTTQSAPPAPANDACATATAITTFPYNDTLDAGGTTNNDGFITVCSDNGMNDGVWYTFVGDGSDITVTATSIAWDAQLGIYTGACGALTCVNTVDDGLEDDAETLTIAASEVGTTYYINFGQYSGFTDNPEGQMTIDVTSAAMGIDNNDLKNFAAYPNPVKDILNLSYTKNITNVGVFNLLGQQVIAKTVNSSKSQIDMSNLSVGTYLVKVTSDEATKTIKVVKE